MLLASRARWLSVAAVSVLAAFVLACGPTTEPAPPVGAPASSAELQPTATPSATSESAATDAAETAAAATSTTSDAERVVAELADGAWGFLQLLTSEFSPRESATEEEQVAAEFLLSEFEAIGLQVELQPFTVELLSRDTPALSIIGTEERGFRGFPMTFSARGQASGLLHDAGKAFAGEVVPEELRGKIALIERGSLTFEAKVRRVVDAGAVAAVVYNNQPGEFGGRLTRQSSIPTIAISKESGEAVKALMAGGDVTATVSVVFETRASRNVIAEMPGTSGDGRVVVLGAHYDTVGDTQGANDNGSGLATLMTIARQVSGKSYPFALRFIAFGSEEVGLFGSRFYVNSLSQGERESIVAMLNFDVPGSGEFPEVIGSRDLVEEAVAQGAANGIEVHRGVPVAGASSDHAIFRDVGIPVAFFLADDLTRINSTADTLEFVRPELMGISAFLGLRVLDTLADRFR